MKRRPFAKTLTCIVVALAAISSTPFVHAANPFLRLRANVSLTNDANGVRSWVDPTSGITATVADGQPQPSRVGEAVNGHTALSFAGNSYMTVNTPDCFKGSYTLYAVVKYNGASGANNVVSGNAHALWLNNTTFPHVLHDGNFSQLAVSNVPLNGWSVLRVMFDATTGVCRIAVNNAEGASNVIPQTADPTFLIGAFQGANNFNGEIAEVVYYHGVLSDADRVIEDQRLHGFYNIARVADPPPPVVVFTKAPKHLQVIPFGDSLRVKGFVVDPSVLTADMVLDSEGVVIAERHWTIATDGPQFEYVRAMPMVHAHQFHVTVTASRSGTRDTVLNADSISVGVVIAISGQSNSVFGDAGGIKNRLARTFGGNASSSAADTAWSLSNPTLSGGGSTIGAVGMYIQGYLALSGVPSAVINGGVGGTTIQQHLPYAPFTESLSTIHGSWAYRRRIADVNKFINWMIWYQGESNTDADNYTVLFDSVYRQWHLEMPNLKHVIVVQIRPGCGGPNHALLREQQRLLQQRYSDVTVIAASGLPSHDGCHYAPDGYSTLGTILSKHIDAGGLDGAEPLSGAWSSPDIASATFANEARTSVLLRFRGYRNFIPALNMTNEPTVAGEIRTHKQAFFANGADTLMPTSIMVDANEVRLTFPTAVNTISYIPPMYYARTTVTYEGPFLVNEHGVGALMFANVPVTEATDVDDVPVGSADARNHGSRVVSAGDRLTISDGVTGSPRDAHIHVYDMRGTFVCEATVTDSTFVVPPLAAAPYLIVTDTFSMFVIVR